MYNFMNYRGISYKKDDRFIPFAGPFLLGALTGGVAVGALGQRPRPYYNQGYYPRPNYYPYYY